MADETKKRGGWAYQLGCKISSVVSDVFAHPYAQIIFILVCSAWFALGLNVNVLTAALSIMAITLTQMVLNRQNEREIDAHRRDVAMHAKLDELIAASRRARNDMVGIEEMEEEEIVQLKDEVKEAINEAEASPEVRERAKDAVEEAAQEVERSASKGRGRSSAKPRKASAKR